MAAMDGCDKDAWQPKTAADGDTRGADAKRDAEGWPLMGTARGDIDEGRLIEAALVILTVGRGEGLLEGVIFLKDWGDLGRDWGDFGRDWGGFGKGLVGIGGILRVIVG